MTTPNPARVHVKCATLAFPKLHPTGAKSEDGRPLVSSCSLVVDMHGKAWDEICAKVDPAIEHATRKAFGEAPVDYDATPIKPGNDIKKNGKTPKWLVDTAVIEASNTITPSLYDRSKREVSLDEELFYAGAEVYAILEFVARGRGDKKFLNARLVGLMQIGAGTPIEKAPTLATADEFEIEDDAPDADSALDTALEELGQAA
jgi:hypothetical protein